MCSECPGVVTEVQERVEDHSPNPGVSHGYSEKRYMTITKRVMQPCRCHCETAPKEHQENGREYCINCRHWLRMH